MPLAFLMTLTAGLLGGPSGAPPFPLPIPGLTFLLPALWTLTRLLILIFGSAHLFLLWVS